MGKHLIYFLCMLVCSASLLASCKDASREADNSQNNKTVADNLKTTSEPAKMMELNMNNLLLSVNRIPTTHSEKKGIDYILCVLCDGSVYSMSYCYSSIREHMNFMDKFDSCDNLVWDLVEDIKVLGNLPDEDITLLNDSIAKVDINSEYIENDVRPDVIVTSSYDINCYVSNNDGNKESFLISGTSDKNATNALGLVIKSNVFKNWERCFDDNSGTLYPVKPNVLLFAESIYQESNDMGQNVFLLCVLKDGAVYSIKYCNSPDAGKFDFFEKFDIGDERPLKLIKSLVENFEVEFFWILPDEDIKTVKDRIEKTNTDSEYVRKKKGKNVIKDADYNVYCYISDKSDKKKKVNIIKSQNKKKKYRKISDKNATAAWKLVEKSDIFEKWKAG